MPNIFILLFTFYSSKSVLYDYMNIVAIIIRIFLQDSSCKFKSINSLTSTFDEFKQLCLSINTGIFWVMG